MVKNRFRRGFVKESEEYAADYRFELDLATHEPLPALDLARHLCVPVIALSKHPKISQPVKLYFSGPGNSMFSAATLPDGTYREILHNDFQHPNRQNSNIMHELAHIILGHPPKPPMLENSCRNFDPVAEREANGLAFILLVPKPAALFAFERFSSLQEAALHYGVSVQLLKHRIQVSDVRRWSQNRRKQREV